jgi:hypothetical protein
VVCVCTSRSVPSPKLTRVGGVCVHISQVTCVSPPVERASAVELRVSLNSQIYSNDSLIYRYGFTGFGHQSRSGKRSLLQDYEVALSEANKVGATLSLSGVPTEAIAIDPRLTGGVHPSLDHSNHPFLSTPNTNMANNQNLNAVFDYLPFAPDNCIFFEAGDYTTLKVALPPPP